MTEYSDSLKHLGIDKKQMLASMMSKIPESEKPLKRGREMTKEELEIENGSLSKRIIELQDDKGRLIDEINDWKAKADKAYCEKANAEIKLNEAREIISEYITILKGNTKTWQITQAKAEAFFEGADGGRING